VNDNSDETRCYECPGGPSSCPGGRNCSLGRSGPGALCILCAESYYKTPPSICTECGPPSIIEGVAGTVLLAVAVFLSLLLSCKADGWLIACSSFEFMQLWLLLVLAGQEGKETTLGLLAFTESTLLHPNFLHLECYEPRINLAHKLGFFLVSVLCLGAVSLTHLRKVSAKLRKERDEFFEELREIDDLHAMQHTSKSEIAHELQRHDVLMTKSEIYFDELKIRKTDR
jgi:hypothetical protein